MKTSKHPSPQHFPDGRLSRTAVLVRQSDQFFETLLKFRRLHGLAFAIAGYSESKPSGTVLEKLMGPGKNHRPFHI